MTIDGSKAPQVTHENHLRHWIGPRFMSTYRLSHAEGTRLAVGACKRQPMSFREECYNSARLVYETHCKQGEKVAVLFSGGVDSELTLRSFLEQGIPVEAHHIRYPHDWNKYDTMHVEEYCKSIGIKPIIYDFDPIEWYLSGEAIEYGKFYECSQLVYLSGCYHIEKYIQSGAAVFGGEQIFKKYVDLGFFLDTGITRHKWYFLVRENQDLFTFRFAAYNDRAVVNEFFTYTPEQVLSFIEEPPIKEVILDTIPFKLSIATSKHKAYARTWDFKERWKAHGYEKKLGVNSEALQEILDHIDVPPHEDLRIEVKDMYAMLRGEYSQ